MATIEANLKRIQESEDLSYNVNKTEGDNAKIDEGTLARLIDECKEEQEQRSIMEAASDTQSVHSGFTNATNPYQQSELSMRQLARVNDYSKNIMQAQTMLNKITSSQRTLDLVSKDFTNIYNTSQDKISEVKRFYDNQLRESEEMMKNRPSR